MPNALLWYDGFDGMTTADLASIGYTGGASVQSSAGIGGLGALSSGGGAQPPFSLGVQFELGFRFRSVEGARIVSLGDASGTLFFLEIGAGNQLLYGGGVFGFFGSPLPRPATRVVNTWCWVQILFVSGNGGGGFAFVRVNGELLLSIKYGITVPVLRAVDRISLGNPSISLIEDFYLAAGELDGSGDPVWLTTEVRVARLLPTGDSAVQYTRSGGATNAAAVDEALPNDATDYVISTVAGDEDLYTFEALTSKVDAGSTVLGVGMLVHKLDDGLKSVPIVSLSGTSYELVEPVPMATQPTNYRAKRALAELNPDTAAAWTVSEVDALVAGVQSQ